MHVVCAYLIAGGLLKLWDKEWLRIIGTTALLVVTVVYHGIYNILVSQTDAAALTGYLFPLVTAAAGILISKRFPAENKADQRTVKS
ncbi:MAG: hypothetical protein IJ906_09225 [Oscillospiraceae bacterium]|nr:hypothetical protein [Oscillospiraceae bacterium]